MVKIRSWDATGKFRVLIRGEQYTYYGVSQHWFENFQKWISHGRFGIVMDKLECFSDRKKYEDERKERRWLEKTVSWCGGNGQAGTVTIGSSSY